MRAPTFLIACLVAAAVLAAGTAGWWHYMAARAQTTFADGMQELEARGYDLSHSGLETSGFPTEIRLTLTDAALTHLGDAGMRARIPHLEARAPVWNPEDIRFAFAEGVTAVFLVENEAVEVSASDLRGTVHAERGTDRQRQWRAKGELLAVRAVREQENELLLTAETAILDLGVPEILLLSRDAVATVRIDSRLSRISLSSPTPLGNIISEATISSELTAPLPASWSGPALAAWRDRGGRVTLHQGGLDWGPLGVQGEGLIALDAALRPEGTIQVIARGYEAALDALAREGMLPANQLPAIKLALAFISRQPTPDAPREAGARLDLEDGWLKLGPFRLAPLPSMAPH